MDDAVIITLATIFSAVIGLMIRYSFRSKCEDVNCCCGLIKFHRDVCSEKPEITTQESNEEIKNS